MLKPLRNIKSLLENKMTSKHCLLLVGGVLSVMALAFIPNSAYAVDHYIDRFVISETYQNGCNTVQSDGGITAIGARGSLLGSDNNETGCGYYIDSQYNLSFRPYGISTSNTWQDGAIVNGGSSNYIFTSLQNDDYISKNFRSTLKYFDVGHNVLDTHFYGRVEASTSNKPAYLLFTIYKIKEGVVPSSLTPSVVVNSNNFAKYEGSFSSEELKTLEEDLYHNTIFFFGSPKDYVDPAFYSYLMSTFGLSSDDDWDTQDFAFIATYLPQYNFAYSVNHFQYSVDTDIVQNNLNLGGFSQWYVGIGNNSSSSTFPKLDYFNLSQPYNKNFSYPYTSIRSLSHFVFTCSSESCLDTAGTLLNNYHIKHSNDVSGWDFTQNPGSSWFNVFNFGVIFPFSSLFNSFTDNRCVDIPIIASWLSTSQSHVCTWWSNDIRSTLTPIFSTISLMILFGFIINWLKGSSSPLFSSGLSNTGDSIVSFDNGKHWEKL